MNNLAFLRTLIHGLVVLLVASQLVFAQKVVDRSSSELPPWTTEPPVGKYFTYYSGVGSSPNSLSDAKEQSIANVLSEIIMEGEITAESRIETFHQQSKEGIISEVSREIQQTGASTTIGGLRKEEEYWQTVKTGDGLLYQYWILIKIPKPEYASLDISVDQGYGIAPIWRSALVPGWGQFNKGEKKKGLRLLGSEAALASTFFICQQISRDYSRKPISGATITTDPITSSKTTDSEGAFTIEGVEPGTYTVQGSKTGYQTNSTIINVIAGETASGDIQLTPLGPELTVSATMLNFGTSSTNLTFTISNSGIGTLTWSVISSSNWVTVNPTSGTTGSETDVVTVTVNRTAMAYGNHYETITVASNANSSTIDIIMTVPNPNAPQLSVYPISLDFGTSETEMTFYVSNTGTGLLTWNITDDKPWISVDPQSGTTESEIDEITVTIDRLGQSSGTYAGTVSVSSDGGNQSVTVSFTVPDEPLLSISPMSLDFGISMTSLSFDVANAGSGNLTWSVTDNQEWITTSPSSGTNYGTVNVTVSRDGLSPGNYSGAVIVVAGTQADQSGRVSASAKPLCVKSWIISAWAFRCIGSVFTGLPVVRPWIGSTAAVGWSWLWIRSVWNSLMVIWNWMKRCLAAVGRASAAGERVAR